MEFKQRFTDVANEYLVLVEDHAQGVNILDIRTKHVTAVRSGAAIAVALEHMQNRPISLAELEQCNLIFKAMVPKSNKRRRGAYGYHHKNPDQPVPILIDEFFLILAAMPKERKALQSMVAPVPREPGEYRCLQKAAVTELLDFDPADPRVVHTCKKGEHVEMVTDTPSASPLIIAALITAANSSRVHEEP